MIPPKVRQILEQHGLSAREFEEGSTPTSVAAADKLGVEVGQIAKSLLFKGKDGRFFLILCAGDIRTSTKKIKELTGVQTRMATPEELLEQTGFPPGAVCPFGVEGPEIFMDDSLKRWETIYPAAGTDSSGVPVSYGRLKEIIGARTCDIAGENQ